MRLLSSKTYNADGRFNNVFYLQHFSPKKSPHNWNFVEFVRLSTKQEVN